MNFFIILAAMIVAGIIIGAAAGAAGFRPSRRPDQARTDVDVTLSRIYQSHVTKMEEQAALAIERSVPDDVWLAEIKSRAELEARRSCEFSAVSMPIPFQMGARRPQLDIVERSSMGWAP